VALIAASNIVLNRVVPRQLAAPAGLAAAGCMTVLASSAGADLRAQGLSPGAAGRGLKAGLALGIPIGAIAFLGAYMPMTRSFFRDHRIVSLTPAEAAHEVLVRMPLATAAGEEVLFRGGFESLLESHASPSAAALASAFTFGAWHILPTYDRLGSNPGMAETHKGSAGRQLAIIAASACTTAVAGLGFSWLRRRTGSVVAPILVHWSINAAAFVGGWLATRAKR
jgi:CAAX protease family protein